MRLRAYRDGPRYAIYTSKDLEGLARHIGFRLFDVTGDDALGYFTHAQLRTLIRDLEEALPKLGKKKPGPWGAVYANRAAARKRGTG